MSAKILHGRRVLVAGISGAGKSTLCQTLSKRLGSPYVELDSLFHGQAWTKRETFEVEVEAFSGQPSWVTEDQYQTHLGQLLWERAAAVVWLDYSRPVVMFRVIRRSVARAITRRPMWNGNKESILRWLDADHPIRWAWTQHRPRRERLVALSVDSRFAGTEVLRFRRPRETRAWARSLGSSV